MDLAELAVVFIVALVVLGPKQLVRSAYLLGQLLQIIKRFFTQLKLSIEKEITLDELKRSLQKPLFSEAKSLPEAQRDSSSVSAAEVEVTTQGNQPTLPS